MVDFHALTERIERLYTPRLALRQASLADGWPLFAASRNQLFNEYLLWDQPVSEWPVLDRVDAIVEAARRGRLTAVSAVERETGAWVSLFRFQPFGNSSRTVEMGVWTHHAFWRGAYTFELVSACIDAVFSFTEVDEIVAAASPAHERSLRLLSWLGLTHDGEIVRRPCDSGRVADFFEHRLTRVEWLAQLERRRFEIVEAANVRTAPSAPIQVHSELAGAIVARTGQPPHAPRKTILEPLKIQVQVGPKESATKRPLGRRSVSVPMASDVGGGDD